MIRLLAVMAVLVAASPAAARGGHTRRCPDVLYGKGFELYASPITSCHAARTLALAATRCSSFPCRVQGYRCTFEPDPANDSGIIDCTHGERRVAVIWFP